MSPAAASSFSICLVRLSALGDVVMVLPLLRALQARWPEARITWVIGRAVLPALAGLAAEGVDFVVIDKPRGPGDYLRLRRQLASSDFDVLLCLQASLRANLLYPCIRAKRKIGYGSDRAKDLHRWFVAETLPPAHPHLVDGFLQFAEALGLPRTERVEWRLPVDPQASIWADETLPKGPFLALSPCASKPERDWPAERFAALVQRAAPLLPVVLLGGPGARERAQIDAIQALSGAEVLDLAGRTSLPQLVAVLSRCRVLVAPDTGAVHIANAFGRPVVGLYAVAPASRTGPYGNIGHCVDRFPEAVRRLQGLDPSQVPWAHRAHDLRAMQLIGLEDVWEKLSPLLAK
jgi:heptosyltransferase I